MFCSFVVLVLDQSCGPKVDALAAVVLPRLRRLSCSVGTPVVYLGVVACYSLPG